MKKIFSICLAFMLLAIVGCKSETDIISSDLKSSNSEKISTSSDNKKDEKPITTPDTSSKASKTQPTISKEDKEEPKLLGVDKLRPDYNYGECKDLSGNITVIVFYLDDFESSWTFDEMTDFTANEIRPGLTFLENSAKKYGKRLNLKIEEIHSDIFYSQKVEVDINKSGLATIDVLYTVAKHFGYKDESELVITYKEKYKTEVICYCVFNKEGSSYGINPKRGSNLDVAEHGIIFAYDIGSTGYEPIGCQSSVIAHETLHLYGAEDYYSPAERKLLAQKEIPNDIMLSCKYYISENDFGDATAFYIGWINKAPDILYDERWNGE